MKITTIARELGVSTKAVRFAVKAVGVAAEESLHSLTPGQALEVVGWLQDGRYDALRRVIQADATHRARNCPACGTLEVFDAAECANCGRTK